MAATINTAEALFQTTEPSVVDGYFKCYKLGGCLFSIAPQTFSSANPLSTFRKQTRQRKCYIMPSKFVKDEWLGLRGMDDKGKFIQEEDSRADAWKNVAKSDRLVRKYAGDAFANIRLDDGLHAIVAKDSTSEEKKLAKQ